MKKTIGINYLGERVYDKDGVRFCLSNGFEVPQNLKYAARFLLNDSSISSIKNNAYAYYVFNRKKIDVYDFIKLINVSNINNELMYQFAMSLNHHIIDLIENLTPAKKEIDFCSIFLKEGYIEHSVLKNYKSMLSSDNIPDLVTNYGLYNFNSNTELVGGLNYNDKVSTNKFKSNVNKSLNGFFVYKASEISSVLPSFGLYDFLLLIVRYKEIKEVDLLKNCGLFDHIVVSDGNTIVCMKSDIKEFSNQNTINGYKDYDAPCSKDFAVYQPQIRRDIYKHLLSEGYEDIEGYVSNKIGYTNSELQKYYSVEQIDGIAQIIYKIENNQSIILADETGVGKGRTLVGVMRYAKIKDKNIIFITESSSLFSDIYRDIINTKSYDMFLYPVVINTDVQIRRSDNMDVIYNKKTPKNIGEGSKLILATYSQFNKVSSPKLKELKKYSDDAIYILDESHNAIGDSNIKKNIESILGERPVVFSSATYLKDIDCLDIYKNIVPLCFSSFGMDDLKEFVKLSFENQIWFSKKLAKNGFLIRREHSLNFNFETIIVKSDKIIEKTERLTSVIREIFLLYNKLVQLGVSQHKEPMWYMYGGLINRLYKQYLSILKVNELENKIQEFISKDKKIVVVLENTSESFLKSIKDGSLMSENFEVEVDEDVDGLEEILETNNKNIIPTFKEVLMLFVRKMSDNYNFEKSGISELKETYFKICNLIGNDFEDVCSLIDVLMGSLKDKGIKSVEISGRNLKYDLLNKKVISRSRDDKDRLQSIYDFNNSDSDVAVVTRAASAGVSLHSSKDVMNKKERIMLELEIISNPVKRMQIFGRIRRKNILGEAYFYTLLTELIYEKRIYEYQNKKIEKISNYISGGQIKLSEGLGFYSDDMYNIKVFEYIKDWIAFNPQSTYLLGIKNDDLNSYKSDDYIDRFLKRVFLLTYKEQEIIFNDIQGIGENIQEKSEKVHVVSKSKVNNHIDRAECFSVNKGSILPLDFWGDNQTIFNFCKDILLKDNRRYSFEGNVLKSSVLNFFKNFKGKFIGKKINFIYRTQKIEGCLYGIKKISNGNVFFTSNYLLIFFDINNNVFIDIWLNDFINMKYTLIDGLYDCENILLNDNYRKTFNVLYSSDMRYLLNISSIYNFKIKNFQIKNEDIIGVQELVKVDFLNTVYLSEAKELTAYMKRGKFRFNSNIDNEKNVYLENDTSGVYFHIHKNNKLLGDFYISKNIGRSVKVLNDIQTHFIPFSIFYKFIYSLYGRGIYFCVSKKN